MDMIEKRNLTSHAYNLDVAETVTEAVRTRYYPASLELQNRFAGEP